jgi:hypothetical protein
MRRVICGHEARASTIIGVTKELDTLATALYVKTGDLLKAYRRLVPWRPRTGIAPQLSDAEVVTLAVLAGTISALARVLARETSIWSGDRAGRGLHAGGMRPLASERPPL